MITVHVHGKGVADDFAMLSERVTNRVAKAVYQTGALLQTKVRANASGRPGPNALTGDYRRGISVLNGTSNGLPVSVVYSNSPQAARLEYGFVGLDSLGRRYNQPPYPHWGPAVLDIEEFFYRSVREAIKGGFK